MKQFLLKRCGNASYLGFELIAYILENYKYPIKLSEVYKDLAKKFNLNSASIERRIRTYREICGYNDINNHEFISILMIEAEN